MTVATHAQLGTNTLAHPTPCPAWCQHLGDPITHQFGPTSTAHWGNTVTLPAAGELILTAELCRIDEGASRAEVGLYLQGCVDAELDADGVDDLIVNAENFVTALRVMRGQMGGRA